MSRRAGKMASGLLISAGTLVVAAVLFLSAEMATRLIFPERCAQMLQRSERIVAARSYLAPCGVSDAAEGVTRIAVVGESSADLLANELARRLHGGECEGSFEVLNCAQPGSALEHVERRFREVLLGEPDAIVLLFGHNILFRFELDDANLRLAAWRARSCLVSQLGPQTRDPAPPALDERMAALETFLRQAASTARANGIQLVIATMPGNLWLPPSPGPDGRDHPRFLEAQFLEATGRRDEAIELLEALAETSDDPFWHYQLGEQLARAGNAERAYHELHLALDADHVGMRAPGRLNDLVRRVAAEEGVLLRDSERGVESRAPQGLPGWETFGDNCHLLPDAIDREVDGVLKLLDEPALGLPPMCKAGPRGGTEKGIQEVLVGVFDLAESGPPDLAQRWYRALSLAVESWLGRDSGRTDRDVNAFLDSATFEEGRDEGRDADVLVALAEGYDRAGQYERALELNRQVREAGNVDAWVQNGLFRLRRGDESGARQAFERAVARDASRADASTFLRLLTGSSEPSRRPS